MVLHMKAGCERKRAAGCQEVSMKNWMVKSHPVGGGKSHLHAPPTLLISAAVPPNTLGTWKGDLEVEIVWCEGRVRV